MNLDKAVWEDAVIAEMTNAIILEINTTQKE